MTNKKRGTAASVSVYELARICKEVDRDLEAELAGVFAQKRTYEKAAAYVAALGDPAVLVKTCWSMAEGSGNKTPGQFQSLIGENKWVPGKVWDGIAVTAARSLSGNPGGDLLGPGVVTDETADEKRGKRTAGVSRQYAGCAGGIVNCVTWVMMSLIGAHRKTWVSARVFLPEKTWFTGEGETGTARREKAGIPGKTAFASKPELARLQYEHLRELGIPFFWAAGDEVYGRYRKLREDHEENGEAYAYFIPRNYMVRTSKGESKKVDELLDRADSHYELRTAGPGLNGPRYYKWAMLSLESKNHFLLIRKPESAEPGAERETGGESTGKESAAARGETPPPPAGIPGSANPRDRVKDELITFCICYIPEDSPIRPTMTNMVTMAGRRWGAEEANSTAKGPIGWDESQFRQWRSTQHHTALAGVAMLRANLIRERLSELPATPRAAGEDNGSDEEETAGAAPAENIKPSGKAGKFDLQIPLGDSMVPYSADQERPAKIGCISLSLNEILRLVSIVSAEMSKAKMAFHIAWSKWRRQHQAIARWHRMQHRMKADQRKLANHALTGLVTLCK